MRTKNRFATDYPDECCPWRLLCICSSVETRQSGMVVYLFTQLVVPGIMKFRIFKLNMDLNKGVLHLSPLIKKWFYFEWVKSYGVDKLRVYVQTYRRRKCSVWYPITYHTLQQFRWWLLFWPQFQTGVVASHWCPGPCLLRPFCTWPAATWACWLFIIHLKLNKESMTLSWKWSWITSSKDFE